MGRIVSKNRQANVAKINGDNMEFTQEQKNKLRKLKFSFQFKSMFNGFKSGILLFLTNVAIVLINVFYVNSNIFVFVSSFINCVFIFHYLNEQSKKELAVFQQEVKRVLENKSE